MKNGKAYLFVWLLMIAACHDKVVNKTDEPSAIESAKSTEARDSLQQEVVKKPLSTNPTEIAEAKPKVVKTDVHVPTQKAENKLEKKKSKKIFKSTHDDQPIEPKNGDNAIITFERMSHSFGELESGDTYEHKFHFTNTGSTDLTIEEVKVSCGCTQPSYPFIPIAPGDTGYIGIVYNSVGKEGPQRPKITVYTNGEPAIFNLYLEGEVLEKAKSID